MGLWRLGHTSLIFLLHMVTSLKDLESIFPKCMMRDFYEILKY